MIDLDFFKHINDEFGHSEGDRVLTAVGAVLQSACRRDDMAARYGGEEFTVALPNTNADGSIVVAEAIRCAIERISGLKENITASIGIATHEPLSNVSPVAPLFAELINRADRALYAAKRGGRNCVCHENSLV